jgi:hypothetical protein
MYKTQHCFICRPSDLTVSEDAGTELRTVATLSLAVTRSDIHSARSHPQKAWSRKGSICLYVKFIFYVQILTRHVDSEYFKSCAAHPLLYKEKLSSFTGGAFMKI